MVTEQHIKLAAKLYSCRDAAKRLYGAEYQNKISDYKRYIQACMIKHNYQHETTAAMRLIEDCKEIYGVDVATMNILAACVELIEPSK